MIYSARIFSSLMAGCVLSMTTSGCITIAPNSPSLSWKSLTKPKIERASYEEEVEEAPGDPKHPAKLHMAYGRLMEESGQLTEARKNYATVVESQPKNVDAILGLARIDQLSGNLEQAEIGFKRAVKIAPNSASAQMNLGQYYASRQQWQAASEALTKAMLANPEDTQARYALAVSLVHMGNVDAALPHFIRTVGDAEAHYNVGLILQEDGQLEEAERHLTLAVTKKPDLAVAHRRLADVRQQRQNLVNAPQPAGTTDSAAIVPAGHNQVPSSPNAHSATPAPVSSRETRKLDRKLSAQQIEQQRNQLPISGS